jgi:hypothetical protein
MPQIYANPRAAPAGKVARLEYDQQTSLLPFLIDHGWSALNTHASIEQAISHWD